MRGILMIEPLYQQTVKGVKTQTRRSSGLEEVNENPDNWEEVGSVIVRPGGNCKVSVEEITFSTKEFIPLGDVAGKIRAVCKPRYKIGEVLYLKEPTYSPQQGTYWYRYNMFPNGKVNNYKWSNKLFMPASAARAFVKITGVKCERLLDISDEDAIAEGIIGEVNKPGTDFRWKNYITDEFTYIQPAGSFLSLFKFANKMKAGAEVPNIWVFCYEFEYLKDHKS